MRVTAIAERDAIMMGHLGRPAGCVEGERERERGWSSVGAVVMQLIATLINPHQEVPCGWTQMI